MSGCCQVCIDWVFMFILCFASFSHHHSKNTQVLHFSPDPLQPHSYSPIYGRSTTFFVWNAIIIGLEHMVGGAKIFQLLKNNLPRIAVSLLVSLTALPMAHWFTFDYVKSDFFHDGQIGFPMIVLQH